MLKEDKVIEKETNMGKLKKNVCNFVHLLTDVTRPNSALDLSRRCTFSMYEQSLCKVLTYIKE